MNLVHAKRILSWGSILVPVSALVIWGMTMENSLAGIGVALAMAIGFGPALQGVRNWFDTAHNEQIELRNQLVQSQKLVALGEISTGIAHEINNPLNIIMQEAELMRVTLAQTPTPEELEEIRESLAMICHQVERCSDITHKLLDFARNRRPVTQAADINRLLMDMLALVERETSCKNIQIIKMFGANIPQVMTDPPLLRQVFLNLLNNAVQALENGGMIFVTTCYRNGMACAEIRDTGPGIPLEDQDRVFDPFFTTKPPGQGTGLGLSLSLRIINQLGGTITLRSEPGKGSAFTISVPANQ